MPLMFLCRGNDLFTKLSFNSILTIISFHSHLYTILEDPHHPGFSHFDA